MKKLLILILLTTGLAQAQVSTTFDRIFRQNGGRGLSQRNYSDADSAALTNLNTTVGSLVVARNLYQSAATITDQYIQSGATPGNIITLAGARTSGRIAVKPSTQYTIAGYVSPSSAISLFIRYENAAQSRISGESLNNVAPTTFTTPALCQYVIFSVYRADFPQSFANITLVETALLPNPATVDQVTFGNSDKIGMLGCSYTEGGGISVKNKAWINKVSAYTNYQLFNGGVGGDRFVDITDRLRKNTAFSYTTRGYGIKDMKARFLTVNNVGNEVLNYTGVNSELYSEEIKELTESIRAAGSVPIYSTDWLARNPLQGILLKRYANQEGSYFHDQGTVGEQLLTIGSPSFMWWGTHPNSRGNAHAFNEWRYYLDRLPKPRKSIKVFRPRSELTIASVQSLNYDSFEQRAAKLAEIQVANSSLNETSEASGWGYYDRSNLAPSYTYSSYYADEYMELMSKNPVSFSGYSVLDITLDKIRNTAATVYVKMAQNSSAKFWLKNYFNTADYAYPAKSNQGVILTVTKSVYDGLTITPGDSYTTTQVLNGSAVPISLVMKGKMYSYSTGYIVGLETAALASPTTKTTGIAGTLTRTSGTGVSSFTYTQMDASLSEHSYAFVSGVGKPEGSFADVTTKATFTSQGYYAIPLAASDLALYCKYDNIKLAIDLPGSFTIADAYVEYTGGTLKDEQKVWYSPKLAFTEKLPQTTISTSFTSTGGWVNNGASLTAISSTYRDYPPIAGSTNQHVELGYGVDYAPNDITKTVTVTPKQGYRRVAVRVVARVWPKFYRPDVGNTSETTTTRQITPDSFDMGTLCVGIKGNNVINILKRTVDIGWAEHYYEFDLPPGVSTFDVKLFRDPADVIDPINYRNHTYPLQICYVSVQVEGE